MRSELFVLVTMLAVAVNMVAANAPKRRYINLPGKSATLPFSDAVLVGDTLYLSGRIGIDPKTGQAPADLDQEIKLLLDGFEAVLKQVDMSMDDVVQATVFSPDLALFDKWNAAYRARFKGELPARAFIGAGSLLRGGHFEMMGIAVKR